MAAEDGPLPIPPLTGRVVDLTGTLDAQQRATLEARLAALEKTKGAQVAVLLAPTFRPESIEQFGIRLAEAWKLGRKGVDDGAILLIAKDDHELRIEVGYGLEGALNDAISKRIISEIIVPHFRQGDYYAGIEAGLAAIQQVIEGEPLPPPNVARNANAAGSIDNFLPLLIAGAIAARVLHGLLGLTGGLLIAGLGGLLAFWLAGSWLAAAIVAVILLFAALSRGGGFGGFGGFGGGLGGGGFGNGGCLSGGCGGFGGGVASGRW
jgi:uncharacterized protein